MSVDALTAAQTYAQVAKTAADAPRADAAEETARPNFAGLVQEALRETTGALAAGESAAASVAAGEASLVDVATAVSAAEVALETAIAVRNRVIEAYQEVMRMPI
ncbi:MAG: flagellar hook-basal body complex protein FliE [Parvularculaceae bacterium]